MPAPWGQCATTLRRACQDLGDSMPPPQGTVCHHCRTGQHASTLGTVCPHRGNSLPPPQDSVPPLWEQHASTLGTACHHPRDSVPAPCGLVVPTPGTAGHGPGDGVTPPRHTALQQGCSGGVGDIPGCRDDAWAGDANGHLELLLPLAPVTAAGAGGGCRAPVSPSPAGAAHPGHPRLRGGGLRSRRGAERGTSPADRLEVSARGGAAGGLICQMIIIAF